ATTPAADRLTTITITAAAASRQPRHAQPSRIPAGTIPPVKPPGPGQIRHCQTLALRSVRYPACRPKRPPNHRCHLAAPPVANYAADWTVRHPLADDLREITSTKDANGSRPESAGSTLASCRAVASQSDHDL